MVKVNLFSAMVQVTVAPEEYGELSSMQTMDLMKELSEFFAATLEGKVFPEVSNLSIEYGVELEVTSNGKPVE
jgi:hypothetical protein